MVGLCRRKADKVFTFAEDHWLAVQHAAVEIPGADLPRLGQPDLLQSLDLGSCTTAHNSVILSYPFSL